jgi:hypothetical protein
MFRPIAALSALFLLAACTPPVDSTSETADGGSVSDAAITSDNLPAGTASSADPVDPDQPVSSPDLDTFPPSAARDLTDMVGGCQGMNPEKRPRGSNCHGIFPEQCGADKARGYVGKRATPAVRDTIIRFSPNGDVRFIRPGDAVIEDLRTGRLNIQLSESGVIESADCY